MENKDKKREEDIDYAMQVASKTFKQLTERGDPYAMHKTVESLPVEILVDIVHQKICV